MQIVLVIDVNFFISVTYTICSFERQHDPKTTHLNTTCAWRQDFTVKDKLAS